MSIMLTSMSMSLAASTTRSGISPARLRCEFAVNPLGVDTASPRLSWIVTSDLRDQIQAAFEIKAASSPAALMETKPDLWDSGRVASRQTLGIAYGGQPLKTGEHVYWCVRVWDRDGKASTWSSPAEWTMGVLHDADWIGQWIQTPQAATTTDSTLLRGTFQVKSELKRALAFVCGLGQYEFSVNGQKIGDDVLSPGWTNYKKTCLYDTRDITSDVKPGANVAGLILGNGMYNVHGGRYTKFTGSFAPQKAILQIRLEYSDGTVDTVGTSNIWRTHPGPITFSSIFGGEDYDARLVQSGWDKPGFDDQAWFPAEVVNGPGGSLKGFSCSAPPIKTFETFAPIAVKTIRAGISVYDLGQNASQMIRLTVHGPTGSSVTITPAELVHDDGTVDRESVGGGQAYWKYTLAGNGVETYFPKFFYQGCRYLQVELSSPDGQTLPIVDSLKGVVIGADSPSVGQFSCSNELFNKIFTLVRWAQRSNMMSVLTDCPHRERLGWLEESHLNGPSLRYNFDLTRNYSKIENDMADSQTGKGLISSIAPEYVEFGGGFRDSPEWGSALVLNAWQQYQFTGDESLLTRSYNAMTRYVDYLSSKSNKDGVLDYGLGDWYDIGPKNPGYAQLTPAGLTATAFWYEDATIVAKTASMMGNTADAQRYAALAASIKVAFNKTYWNSATDEYSTGSDTANAIPLVMRLAPEYKRVELVDKIVAYIVAHDGSFTAGDIGYRYVLTALAEGGRSDVIYAMNNQTTRPGYGMQIAKGATSLTEAWNAYRSSSQNHFMLGQIVEWMYAGLAGIAVDPDAPGFSHFYIAPNPVGDLTSASATYDSVRGPIAVAWKKAGDKLTLDVEVPANTTATVKLPLGISGIVQLDGKIIQSANSPEYRRIVGQLFEKEIRSGKHHFELD